VSCVLFLLGYSPAEDSNLTRVAKTLLSAPLPALSHWLALLGSPLAYFSAFMAIPQNHTTLAFVPIVLLELGGSRSFFDFAVLERDGSWYTAIGPWDLPEGRSRLRAWIYDPDRSAVAPLRGKAWIEKQGERLTGAWVEPPPSPATSYP